jgi:hypothetical protein
MVQTSYYHVMVPFNQLANFKALMEVLADKMSSQFLRAADSGAVAWLIKLEGDFLSKSCLQVHGVLLDELRDEKDAEKYCKSGVGLQWRKGFI